MNELKKPTAGHWKNISTGDIYEGDIYLGKYDNAINYTIATEEEYQQYLKEKEVESMPTQGLD